MNADQLRAALDAGLADRQLLQHPFYLRWEAGTLRPGELCAYACADRHFETALPGLLRGLLSRRSRVPQPTWCRRTSPMRKAIRSRTSPRSHGSRTLLARKARLRLQAPNGSSTRINRSPRQVAAKGWRRWSHTRCRHL